MNPLTLDTSSPEGLVNPAVNRRIQSYWILGTALALSYPFARNATWLGSTELHTLMETAATLLALAVGVIALVRFYSKKNNTFLFIGAGFLGTALLDGYHAVVTSSFFAAYLPSDLPSLITWSWIASRLFLSIMLTLSWAAWLHEQRRGRWGLIGERSVYVVSGLLTATAFLFFAFVPLPDAYYPDLFFHRPEEFGPALFFAVALTGYLKKGAWRHDTFEHWLVLSLIVGVVGQAVFMSFSDQLFDIEFDIAHTLKKVSYLLVLVGLLISMLALFRQAEESPARVRSVVDNALDGIVTVDELGTVREFNPAAEGMFDLSAAEAIGRNIKLLMPEPDRGRHDAYIDAYVNTGRKHIIGSRRRVEGQRRGGTVFPIDLAVSEMLLGERRLFVGIIHDATERVRAETEIQQRSADLEATIAELETFSYSVSHDLRAPLQSMVGFSEELLERHTETLSEDGIDYLQRIHAAGLDMGHLIDGLLGLSRATRGTLATEEIDLSALAQSVVDALMERDPSRLTSVEIEPNLLAHTDPRLIRSVLENLLGNAWKFTSKRPRDARIRVGAREENGATAYFVEDNGVGLDMAYADSLFTPFRRLHSQEGFPGAGIGLATVDRIVQRHGGRVWVQAEPGEGATFYFTLNSPTKSEPEPA